MKLLREKKLHPGLQLILKLLLTTVALVIVLHNTDLVETWRWLQVVPGWIIFIALFLYNISQIVSAWRLALFFSTQGISISFYQNLKLYYQGMFYNLFLPGGIGGDGYKVFTLRQKQGTPVLKSVGALMGDRVNGAVTLAALALALVTISVQYTNLWLLSLGLVGTVLIFVLSNIIVRNFFSSLRASWVPALPYSVAVQVIQLMAATILFGSLNIPSTDIPQYCAVFLISSLFAAIPFTLGGVGAREFVFVMSAEYTTISPEKAIAFSLIFFLLSVVSSLPGSLLKN